MQREPYLDMIDSVQIVVRGSGYESCMDQEIKCDLQEVGIQAEVEGEKTPACGPDIWLDIVIELAKDIAIEGTKKIVRYIYKRVSKKINQIKQNHCELNSTKIDINNCEYIISATSAAGYNFGSIDFNQLLFDMACLRDREKDAKRMVSRIETPCEIDFSSDEEQIQCFGVGNYSLWQICYSDGKESSQCLYDAVNDQLITGAINEENYRYLFELDDIYYTEQESI